MARAVLVENQVLSCSFRLRDDRASLNTHEQFARQAIALAKQARGAGNHPFGALLVLDDEVVLTAMNSVNTDRDPTGQL